MLLYAKGALFLYIVAPCMRDTILPACNRDRSRRMVISETVSSRNSSFIEEPFRSRRIVTVLLFRVLLFCIPF
jgi:hypothetical protein